MIVYFDPLVIAMFSLGVWYSGSCFSVLLFASFLYGICPLVEVSFTFLKILVSRTMLSMMLCHFCCVYTVGVATLKNHVKKLHVFCVVCLLEPFMILIGPSKQVLPIRDGSTQ